MNKVSMIIICVLLVLLLFGIIFNNLGKTKITAEFIEMEPFYKNVDVYYKGFKLGRTTKIYPANDYSDTKVDIVLKVKENILPSNIVAKLKSKGGKDYIDLILPIEPTLEYLKDNATISGEKAQNISSYIDNQAENGGLDEIKDNLNDTIKIAGGTLDSLTYLFGTLDSILKDMKPSLVASSKNIAVMSKNLADVTGDLARSTKPKRLETTFINIENTAKNLQRATSNLENASLSIANLSNKIDNNTITMLDCVIKNINTVVINVNKIILGIKQTLSERFSGLKIILGKAID